MRRLAQLAGGRLRMKRAVSAARDLKELEEQFRAAFIRGSCQDGCGAEES